MSESLHQCMMVSIGMNVEVSILVTLCHEAPFRDGSLGISQLLCKAPFRGT